ncbi:MAG: hypothetical protein LBK23_11820 [Oscillospiraceae bacterium]|jgi:hypothetical protein|nr:hypothetical protein [Oscillospiraceae bacterium]
MRRNNGVLFRRLMPPLFAAFALTLALAACEAAEAQPDAYETPAETERAPPSEKEPEHGKTPGDFNALYRPMLEEMSEALENLDYETVFELQRSQLYRDIFSIWGDMGGGVYDFGGSAFSLWGDTAGRDVSIAAVRPGALLPEDDAKPAVLGDMRISAARYEGKAYMFVGEYVNEAAEGGYTIYLRRDDSPETLEITRLTAQNSIFTADAVRETYENGELIRIESTDEYAECTVPVRWGQYGTLMRSLSLDHSSGFWTSDEVDPFWEQYRPVFERAAAALEAFDYEAVFEIQRSQPYKDFFWALGGSYPAGSFDYDGGVGLFHGNDDDINKVTVIPGSSSPRNGDWGGWREKNGQGGGTSISAMRYKGKAYMFIVEYADGAAEGEYTIYLRRDDSPETLEITRLTVQNNIFTGGAVRETYINGELTRTDKIDEYEGIEVPVSWAGSAPNSPSGFWGLQE